LYKKIVTIEPQNAAHVPTPATLQHLPPLYRQPLINSLLQPGYPQGRLDKQVPPFQHNLKRKLGDLPRVVKSAGMESFWWIGKAYSVFVEELVMPESVN
jgi:hypothetical protein